MQQKLAIIVSDKNQRWESCKIIVPNLVTLYQNSFPQARIETFDYNERNTNYEYFSMFQELKEFMPDKIIICDHKPHPQKIIQDIFSECPPPLPDIYCHLFGDFSLYSNQWLDMETYLQSIGVKFIAASHRQVNFVKQFVEKKETTQNYVHYLPFPVQDKLYRFSSKRRKKAQEQLKISPQAKNFLYTGRLSTQKNISLLTKSFSTFLEISGADAHLYLAGFFDHLAYPFFGLYHPPEFNWYQFLAELESYKPAVKERIHYLGNLSAEELCDYYHACDVFVSASLHNDEDYGMSPAEALCCGMPLILSNWGGYASFCLPKTPVELIKTTEVNTLYQVDPSHLIKLLIKYAGQETSDQQRRQLSAMARKKFSIAGNIKRLQEIHSLPVRPFCGWNKKFQVFSDCFRHNASNPFGLNTLNNPSTEMLNDGARIISKKIYRDCYNEYLA